MILHVLFLIPARVLDWKINIFYSILFYFFIAFNSLSAFLTDCCPKCGYSIGDEEKVLIMIWFRGASSIIYILSFYFVALQKHTLAYNNK